MTPVRSRCLKCVASLDPPVPRVSPFPLPWIVQSLSAGLILLLHFPRHFPLTLVGLTPRAPHTRSKKELKAKSLPSMASRSYRELGMSAIPDLTIGKAVLTGLALVVVSALFIAALFVCRHRGDAARNVVRWLKAALVFMGL